MKRRLLTLVFSVMMIGILGSCSKISERIDGIDQRVKSIEQEKVASIDNQIILINQSIADLEAIRTNIQTLMDSKTVQGEDIAALKAADITLGDKIAELKTYVGTELSKYATTDWANATFATLIRLNATNAELSILKETVNGLKGTFEGELEELGTALTNSIDNAINGVNASISTLEGRVSALEQMIQTVSIIPSYNNGSLKALDGILTINCVINPKEAVGTLKKENFTVFTSESEVLTKGGLYGTIAIANDEDLVLDKENGTATIKVDISSALPVVEGKALIVALNVKNGISDYTTGFVAVIASATPIVDYVEIGGLKWATKNLGATTIAGSGETCYGDYYAWAETEPYYATRTWNGSNKKWIFSSWNSGKGNGYDWLSYCGGSSFIEWSTPPYDNTTYILKDDYDVVKQKLGDGWRMPDSAEFKSLYDACLNGTYDNTTYASTACGEAINVTKGVYWCGNYDGVAGLLFCDGTNKLFFPAAGIGNGTSNQNVGSFGLYWSSAVYSDKTMSYACNLSFADIYVYPQDIFMRYRGLPVRPVSD